MGKALRGKLKTRLIGMASLITGLVLFGWGIVAPALIVIESSFSDLFTNLWDLFFEIVFLVAGFNFIRWGYEMLIKGKE